MTAAQTAPDWAIRALWHRIGDAMRTGDVATARALLSELAAHRAQP